MTQSNNEDNFTKWQGLVANAQFGNGHGQQSLSVDIAVLLAINARLMALEEYAREGGQGILGARVARMKAPGIFPRVRDIGRRVVYIPLHAHGDHWHPDCEHGRIASFRSRPNANGWFEEASVKYDTQPEGQPGKGTDSRDLIWFEDWRPRYTVAELLRAEIMQRLQISDDDGTSEIREFGDQQLYFRGMEFTNTDASLLAAVYNLLLRANKDEAVSA